MGNHDKKELRLSEEAMAFDKQILERIEAGHIPDLRRVEECTYFYNNSWRHPEYVKLDFVEQFETIYSAIKQHSPPRSRNLRALEIGCGPGFLSLELARNQLDVTGIDLSEACIAIAQKYADEDPWINERGILEYRVANFLEPNIFAENSFDVVLFKGSLHHFPDQTAVMEQLHTLLASEGLVIALEPTRDTVTKGNAALLHMMKLLLSVGGGYYQNVDVPQNIDEQKKIISDIYNEMKYEGEDGEKLQSVNDNEAGFEEMNDALSRSFTQLVSTQKYGFFHEVIGGLRFDQDLNNKLARYIRDADAELCKLGVVQPTEFFFVGTKRSV